MIDATFDDRDFQRRLGMFMGNAQKALASGLFGVGGEALRLSQREVPHDKGDLQNSGTVEQEGQEVIVGYHRPYAARLHEHPEYHFQKGRKGKYLEDPIRQNAQELGIVAVNIMRKELHV